MQMNFDKENRMAKGYEIKMDRFIIGEFLVSDNVADAHISRRMGFFRKVFSILAIQLLLTTVISIVFLIKPVINQFIMENTWVSYIFIISNFITLFALFLNSRNSPKNFLLLTLFIILNSISVGFFVSLHNAYDIILSLSITSIVFVSLVLYTCKAKKNLSKIRFISYTLFLTLIGAGIFQFLFPTSLIYRTILQAIGVLCFTGFIHYDVHQIIHQFRPDDYIEAIITLYWDFLNLFFQFFVIIIKKISRRCC
ncbi:hypothetical protein SNEBB_011066 [Seison nebaliae]|nr:hypothetical protein SNEBB_011066 [Seison nebaliae]